MQLCSHREDECDVESTRYTVRRHQIREVINDRSVALLFCSEVTQVYKCQNNKCPFATHPHKSDRKGCLRHDVCYVMLWRTGVTMLCCVQPVLTPDRSNTAAWSGALCFQVKL